LFISVILAGEVNAPKALMVRGNTVIDPFMPCDSTFSLARQPAEIEIQQNTEE
jgi:hypothetical protein